MGATDDADDAAFGTSSTGQTAESGNSCDNGIAVHGVFDVIARNENVAIDIGKRDIGDDEAVTILMKNESAFDFVARSGFVLREFVDGLACGTFLTLRRSGRLARLTEKKTAMREFLDEATFF